MPNVSTILTYPILTLVSIGKKSFRNLGTFIKKSGDTVSRLLQPAEVSLKQSQNISQSMFRKKKKLFKKFFRSTCKDPACFLIPK